MASIGSLQVNNPLALSPKAAPAAQAPINFTESNNGALTTGGIAEGLANGGLSTGSTATAPAKTAPVTTVPAANTAVSQATIDTILQSIANQVAQNQSAYNTAAGYNTTQDQQAAIDHNNQVQSNTASRGTAVQNAEAAAAQGNQGLRAILASLGALNGTGQVLAGRAVADSANNDIGGADKTFQDNATAIQAANTAYNNAAAQRDAALKTNLDTDNQGARATGIQSILTNAHDMGDTATYNKFLPQLVQATAPVQSLQGATTTYNPATVNSFAPSSGLTVTSAPSVGASTPINSALYVNKKTDT